MATELRNSEITILHGDSARLDGLDGDPRPKLIEEIQEAQRRVEIEAGRIHDKSPEAVARRRPFILENLDRVLGDLGPGHPTYLKKLEHAQEWGYLPVPFREPADRFLTMRDLRKLVAV